MPGEQLCSSTKAMSRWKSPADWLAAGDGVVFQTDVPCYAGAGPGPPSYFSMCLPEVRAGGKRKSPLTLGPGALVNRGMSLGRGGQFLLTAPWKSEAFGPAPEPLRGGASVQQIQVTSADIDRAEAACRSAG